MADPERSETNPIAEFLRQIAKRRREADAAHRRGGHAERRNPRRAAAPPPENPAPARSNETPKLIDAKKVIEAIARENPKVRKALGGVVPQTDEIAELLKDWVMADDDNRGNKEVVKFVVEHLRSVSENGEWTDAVKQEAAEFARRIEASELKELRLSDYPATPQEFVSSSELRMRDIQEQDTSTLKPELRRVAEEIQSRIGTAVSPDASIDSGVRGLAIEPDWVEKKANEIINLQHHPDPAKRITSQEADPWLKTLFAISREQQPSRSGMTIHWHEIEDWQKPPDPERNNFSFHFLDQVDKESFIKGKDGEYQWFFEFLRTRERMTRSEMRLDFVDMQKMDEFYRYLHWKYPRHDAMNYEQRYRQHLDARPVLHGRTKILLYEPANEEHQLKALVVAPDEYSYLLSFDYANRATSLYEEEVRNVMMRKKNRYTELDQGNHEKGILNFHERQKRMVEIEQVMGTLKEGDPRWTEYFALLKQKMEHANGVMLWAEDIQFDADRWMTLGEKKAEFDSIAAKLRREDDPGKRTALLAELAEKQLTATEEEFLKNQFKSPIDIEVERQLRLDILTNMPDEMQKSPSKLDLDIELAINSARTFHILTGNIIQIASHMAVKPLSVEGRYRAPWGERLGRIVNPKLFEDRFQFGGKIGFRKRALHINSILRKRGINPHDPEIQGEYRKIEADLRKRAESGDSNYEQYKDKIVRQAEALVRAADKVKHISYEELMEGNDVSIGGPFQGSSWRMRVGAVEPIRDMFLAMGKPYHHQALGFQISAGDPFKRGKETVMKDLFGRRPWLVAQYSPETLTEILKANRGVNAQVLQDTLLSAEMALSHDPLFINQPRDIDLSNREDFNEFMGKALDARAAQANQQGDHDLENALRDVSVRDEYYAATQKLVAVGHERVKEGWAVYNWPMTFSLSDIDLKENRFMEMGEQAIQRRFESDMAAAHGAAQILNAFEGSKPAMFNPNDPVEALKELAKMIDNIDAYGGRPVAEPIVADQLIELFEFNEFKHRHLLEWIPFWEPIARRIPTKWRRRWQGSDSVEFTGMVGNMWDEHKMLAILNTAQGMEFFTQHPELYDQIYNKFHLGVPYRALSYVRKYWWFLPVLVSFSAAKESVEEEKKHS